MRTILLVLFASLLGPHYTRGARILGLLPTPSHSHYIWTRELMVALTRRGHYVTVITPDREKSTIPNYRHIQIEGVYETLEVIYDHEKFSEANVIDTNLLCFWWGQVICNLSLQTNGVKELMKLAINETFDLIITETSLTECFLGFVPLFGYPPVVGVNVFASPPWVNTFMGNAINPAYTPAFLTSFRDRMTFTERLQNFLIHVFIMSYRLLYHLPAQQDFANKYISSILPSIAELEQNITLTFVNTDQRLDFPQPLNPGMIPVAGLHIRPHKALPKDIQTFLNGAKEGAIFFSMGSNFRSTQLKEKRITALVEAFRELPQRILWKWESDSLPGQPSNVMTSKWLPQSDILAHPNIRLFVSHCGLLSTHEALHHGVPVVGIPVFVDQWPNSRRLVHRGVGVLLDFHHLTKDSILAAIREVINNSSYRNRAKEWSRIFRDRPMEPLDSAIYWTEYVLRHRGAGHLHSAALHLSWYQFYHLDVIAVVLAAALASGLLVYIFVKFSLRMMLSYCRRNNKVKIQ